MSKNANPHIPYLLPLLLLSTAGCEHVDDDDASLSALTEGPVVAPVRQALCYVGQKVPGQAPCVLGERTDNKTCLSAIRWRSSELQSDPNLSEAGVGPIGPTDDGGFYQYLGGMGIYCHPSRTRAQAYLVYGAIHDLWAKHGWEGWAEVGYPVSDELDALHACRTQGAVREQLFEPKPTTAAPGFTHVLTSLCWSPDRGAWLHQQPGNTSYQPL